MDNPMIVIESCNNSITLIHAFVLSNRPFKLICYNLAADAYLHYTTDGTVPGISSPCEPAFQRKVVLHGPVMNSSTHLLITGPH